jgi:alpha/beta superfamily hydrolase
MPLREIDGPIGRLECLLEEPASARRVGADGLLETGASAGVRAAVVLAHPLTTLGGTMHTKAVYQAAKALGRIGCAVLRFNFRGAGASAGEFSNGPGEMDDFRAAIDFMAERYKEAPLWTGGMSFGAWIAMTIGVDHPRVSAVFGIATPVCRYDFDPVARSAKAKFLVHGERDEVCSEKEVRAFYARAAETKELVVIDAADLLFDGKVGEVADAIEDLLGDWSS